MIIEVADVSHKWLDGTTSTVLLSVEDHLGRKMSVAYVHTDDSVDEVKANKEKYEKVLLDAIKENMVWK